MIDIIIVLSLVFVIAFCCYWAGRWEERKRWAKSDQQMAADIAAMRAELHKWSSR